MSESERVPPDRGPGPDQRSGTGTTQVTTEANAVAPAQAGGSRASVPFRQKCEKKSFEELKNESKNNRNILEMYIQKPESTDTTTEAPETTLLSYDNFADFIYEELKIKHEDCTGFNYSLSNYANKEVGFKPHVDISPYLGKHSYQGHTIITKRQSCKAVNVTFKNVPLIVPDHELMNIVETYGTPVDSVVHYQNPKNSKAKGIINLNTRYIEMQPGEKKMPNFFWLEGPLKRDAAVRITATYPGQEPQCYNCLNPQNMCPGLGKGKICVSKGTPRTKVEIYIKSIEVNQGFKTLKEKHQREFPELGQNSELASSHHTRGLEEEEMDEKLVSLASRLQEALKLKEEEQSRRQIAEEELEHMKTVLSVGSEEMEHQILAGIKKDKDVSKQIEALADMSYLPDFKYTEGEETLIPPKNFLKKVEDGVKLNKLDDNNLEEVKKNLLEKISERKKIAAVTGIMREQSLTRSRAREKRGLEKEDSTRKVSRRRTHSPSGSPRKTLPNADVKEAAPHPLEAEDNTLEVTISSDKVEVSVSSLGQDIPAGIKDCKVNVKNLHPQVPRGQGSQAPAAPEPRSTASSSNSNFLLLEDSEEQEEMSDP